MDVLLDLMPYLIPAVVLGFLWILLHNRATVLNSAGVDEFVAKGQPVSMRFFKNT